MRRYLTTAIWVILAINGCGSPQRDIPKTTFQTSARWKPVTDIRADAVMVYGTGPAKGGEGSVEERLSSWKEKGYRTDFMTGIAWGSYQDFFTGSWDGVPHWEDGQVNSQGDTLWHGKNVPYIVPSKKYLDYFKETQIKRIIDAGVDAIYLEEPEFWARAGYSDTFKKEWEDYYGTPWVPQDSSPEATYLSNKLKYHLYYRALEDVFTFAKEYGRKKGLEIKCYVPTHSLVNYSMWEIVSPEASLALLPCVDGYIAQVWTGTSRTPTYYNGRMAERIFETAFLEYGSMVSMTAPTGRDLWLLTDPIEDGVRDWEDYRKGYQATFTAQLLYPEVSDYEVMPWPDRIYEKLYPVSAGSSEMSNIPGPYATMMGVMVNALQNMPKSPRKVEGPKGISVLMGNSLMFQRFPSHCDYEDPQLSDFFGLSLPLLKAGIPVGITHIENIPGSLKDVSVLLMTYSNMKPLSPDAHEALRDWVNAGGKLIYSGRDEDPFQNVSEWWNHDGLSYQAPSCHLFELLGLGKEPQEGRYKVGKGEVMVLRADPKEFVMTPGGETAVLKAVEDLYGSLSKKNYLRLERGPYMVAAVMDETPDMSPLKLEGKYIDLYDPSLPVLDGATLPPGSRKLLYDLDKRPDETAILAEAGRSTNLRRTRNSLSYITKGPAGTVNRSRVSLPKEPLSVEAEGSSWTWDEDSRTLLLEFQNNPDGVSVLIKW